MLTLRLLGGWLNGFVCVALAKAFPSPTFVVQDLPSVVQDSSIKLRAEVSSRITLMAYDFFTKQPVEGADVYLFRWIFHNWSDKYCLSILRNLIPALKKGAKVLVADNVLPEPEMLPLALEERIRWVTLTSNSSRMRCF